MPFWSRAAASVSIASFCPLDWELPFFSAGSFGKDWEVPELRSCRCYASVLFFLSSLLP